MRHASVFLVATLLLMPAGLIRAEQGPTLSSFLTAERARPLGAGAAASRPGDVLAAATGVDRLPAPCGAPLVQALARREPPLPEPLGAVRTLLLTRPAPPGAQVLLTQDGRFAVFYATAFPGAGMVAADRNRNGHPDLVDRVAEALEASVSLLEGRLGYPSPSAGRLDVFVTDLGSGLEGYTVPDPGGTFLVLDSGLAGDRVMSAVLHQVAHAALHRLAPGAPAWWDEATAAFLALTGAGDRSGHTSALRARLEAAGRSLPTTDLTLLQGDLLWPWFLAERRSDATVVRSIWEETGRQGIDPLQAADVVLRRGGSSLDEAFREFCLWNLFTGSRDVGRHYPDGRSLPEAPLPAAGSGLPLVLGPVEPVEPLASVAFRLPADPRRGTLDLELRVEGGAPGADLLIRYRGDESLPVLVPLTLEAGGTGRAALPWGEVRDAWIVLRNGATSAAARFEIRGTHDATAPYDLAALSAEASGVSIVLQWTTASETGLLGWNVARAGSPAGPFQRLNGVAIPAWGGGASETGYIFVDDAVTAGRRYYYLLEGLTVLGLAERSHIVSARAPSR